MINVNLHRFQTVVYWDIYLFSVNKSVLIPHKIFYITLYSVITNSSANNVLKHLYNYKLLCNPTTWCVLTAEHFIAGFHFTATRFPYVTDNKMIIYIADRNFVPSSVSKFFIQFMSFLLPTCKLELITTNRKQTFPFYDVPLY